MNVVLIGYRGAGKSTVGRRLAKRLGKRFMDTDDLLEKREGSSIRDIVRSSGWNHFRAMEKQIIKEAAGQDDLVIAPGGGAVLDAENLGSLKRNGLIIWLKAEPRIHHQRLLLSKRTGKSRPPLTGKGTLAEVAEVLAAREPFYEEAADIRIDTTMLNKEEVLERILSSLPNRAERM